MAKVNKINESTIKVLKNKSVLPAPEVIVGKPQLVKNMFVSLITDPTNSVISEINRIVEEVNTFQNASKWYYGNLVKQDNLVVDLEILDAYLNDLYLNNSNGDIFVCVSKNETSSTWQFVYNIKDVINYDLDSEETEISYEVIDNIDKTFSANDITNIELIIPIDVKHGYCAGVNFKSSANPPIITFTNLSNYPLKIRAFGLDLGYYVPTPNRTVGMSLYCDGINVYCYINEVS